MAENQPNSRIPNVLKITVILIGVNLATFAICMLFIFSSSGDLTERIDVLAKEQDDRTKILNGLGDKIDEVKREVQGEREDREKKIQEIRKMHDDLQGKLMSLEKQHSIISASSYYGWSEKMKTISCRADTSAPSTKGPIPDQENYCSRSLRVGTYATCNADECRYYNEVNNCSESSQGSVLYRCEGLPKSSFGGYHIMKGPKCNEQNSEFANECVKKNPLTNDCTCPSDFTQHIVWKQLVDEQPPPPSGPNSQCLYFCFRED